MKHIYLDYNATSPLKPAIYEGMLPYLKEHFGNPSSIHWAGRQARKAMMEARERIARFLRVDAEEIVFTSSGTEANNLALKGTFEAFKHSGKHIITSQVEHSSILACCDDLKQRGAEITALSVNAEGQIDLEDLKAAIRPDTILISIQAANNETGVRLPMDEIGQMARQHQILFHTDAVQMAGKLPLNLDMLPVDMISLSAHKMAGPKGIGALILRRGIRLNALIHGGNQERKRRAGTENLPAIVGFGLACDLAVQQELENAEGLQNLRDRLEEGIWDRIPGARIYGRGSKRVPNTSYVGFEGIESEGLLLNLDLEGIAASAGSACSSGSLKPSHVLLAMGYDRSAALSAIRFSLGHQTTRQDIDTVMDVLPGLLENLKQSR